MVVVDDDEVAEEIDEGGSGTTVAARGMIDGREEDGRLEERGGDDVDVIAEVVVNEDGVGVSGVCAGDGLG